MRTNLGCVFRQLGRADYATAAIKEAIRRRPEFVDAYNHLGITFFEQTDYQRAIQVFEAAVELEPDNAHHYFNIGLVLQVLQQYDRAAQAFVRALQVQENYAEAARQLKWLREAKDNPNLPLLDQIDLFRDLPLEQRLVLAKHLRREDYAAGTVIVKQGQPATRMYIVAEGEVEVSTPDVQDRPLDIHRLHHGDHFGEAALLEDILHSIMAQAVTDVRLLSLSKEHFDLVKSRFPALAQSLVQTRNARLQRDVQRALKESARHYLDRERATEGASEGPIERELTVLVGCLRNAPSLTEALGPGEMLQFLQEFYLQMIRLVGEKGLVCQTAGEQVMVLFDTPLTAVRTALDMEDHFYRLTRAWKRKQPCFTQVGLGIGISTGPVALDAKSHDKAAAGTAVLLAACLAERSQPRGEIYLDEQTQALLAERLEKLIPLPKPIVMEGLDKPVGLFRVPYVVGLEVSQ